MQSTGKFFIAAGAILIIVGVILWLFGNKLNWIGSLPGDIKIERENFKFYFPVTTMILVSVVLSFLISIVRKLF